MSCERHRVEISRWIDGDLSSIEQEKIRRHLESCSECFGFHQEQLELARLFQIEAVELNPPAQIWDRIESRILEDRTAATRDYGRPWLSRLADWFQVPQLAYATAAALLLAFTAIVALQTRGFPEEQGDYYLTRLDAYSIQLPDASSNPFLVAVEEENPFFTELSEPENPFRGGGALK